LVPDFRASFVAYDYGDPRLGVTTDVRGFPVLASPPEMLGGQHLLGAARS